MSKKIISLVQKNTTPEDKVVKEYEVMMDRDNQFRKISVFGVSLIAFMVFATILKYVILFSSGN